MKKTSELELVHKANVVGGEILHRVFPDTQTLELQTGYNREEGDKGPGGIFQVQPPSLTQRMSNLAKKNLGITFG